MLHLCGVESLSLFESLKLHYSCCITLVVLFPLVASLVASLPCRIVRVLPLSLGVILACVFCISLACYLSFVASLMCCISVVLHHFGLISLGAILARCISLACHLSSVLHHSDIASHSRYYSRILHCMSLGTLLAPPNIAQPNMCRVATPQPHLFPASLTLSLRSSLPPSLPPSRPPSSLPNAFPLCLLPPSLANWLLVRKCAKMCRSSHHDMQKMTQRHTQDRSHTDIHMTCRR